MYRPEWQRAVAEESTRQSEVCPDDWTTSSFIAPTDIDTPP